MYIYFLYNLILQSYEKCLYTLFSMSIVGLPPLPSPPRGQWMDCRCNLGSLSNSSTAAGNGDHGGTVGQSYRLAVGTYFFRDLFTYFHFQSFLLAFHPFLFLCRIPILLFPCTPKCLGEHSCVSSAFSIALLNGTCCFCSTKTVLSSGN